MSALKGILDNLEKQLSLHLDSVREKFAHAGIKGASTEAILRQTLRDYLPRRFEVGTGEVIDSEARRSRQLDVVVLNENHPFTHSRDEPSVFFLDGLVAVGEVKSVLTSAHLDSTLDSATAFRELKPKFEKGITYKGGEPWKDPFLVSPPYFLFAYESQLSIKAILERVQLRKERTIDAVFVLGDTALVNCFDGKRRFGVQLPDGTKAEGWSGFGDGGALSSLLFWLSLANPPVERQLPILVHYL